MQPLLDHIQKFVILSESERQLFTDVVQVVTAPKKMLLLEAGKSSDTLYFTLSGCLRLYLVNDKGNEQTLQFAIENWWLGDYLGFHNGQSSSFYIQAIENSTIALLKKQDMDQLLDKIPKLERYFRLCFQKNSGASQMRIRYLFTMSAEERYNHMNKQFPMFVQRIPQYILASYLDVSAEFLSKIRAGKTH